MVEKISVQIALDGGKEVEQQLAAIGDAGEKSLQKTGEAADKAAESISKLSLETVKTAAEIAKLAAEIGLTGVEIVQAVRHHATLIQSLLKLGSTVSTTVRVLSAFTPELTVLGVGLGGIATSLAAAVIGFEALNAVVTKTAAGDEKLNNTLQTLAATTGSSFDSLQNGQAVFEQIGISAETFRGSIAKVNETLAGTDVTGLTKGMKDVVELVKQIAAGDKTIKFADWVTAEDKVKGVSIAMKQAADAGKNATQVLLEFLRSADLATSIKVGAAFGLSEADVDRVRRLNENVSDLIQRVQGAGPLISPEAAAAFDRMRSSIANADSALVRFKQSLGSTVFSAIAASFSAAMNDLKASAVNGAASIVERFNTAFSGMSQQATADIATIKSALQTLGVTDFFGGIRTTADQAIAGLNQSIAAMVGAIMRGMGASEESIKRVQDQINGVIPAANAAGQAAAQAGMMFTQWGTQAEQGANTAKAGVEQATITFTVFGTVAQQAGQQAQQSGQTAASGWDIVSAAIQRAIDNLLEFIGLKPSGGAGPAPAAADGGQFARGGLLGGRGSGTSDSNLAWVSRGEHIMPARAVAQPGMLAFLEALRRSGGNLSAVLDGMGRFALGGMVPRPAMAFAGGGLAGGMSNVTIQFPGLPAIGGLRASSEVVEQLHKAAALAQVRSGGRKPSRYS